MEFDHVNPIHISMFQQQNRNVLGEDILEHCSFDYMKENATNSVPLGGAFWDGGAKTFINKGTNGRWKEMLTSEESEKYDKIAGKNLSPECARWLSTGEM